MTNDRQLYIEVPDHIITIWNFIEGDDFPTPFVDEPLSAELGNLTNTVQLQDRRKYWPALAM